MTGTRRNLILGFCTGYRFKDIESFIASALKIGDDVQLCLFTHGLDKRFLRLADTYGIRVEDASPYLNIGFHPQNVRYFAYQRFLQENRDLYDRVLLTDVRDVFFQSDPFAVGQPKPVCFSLEDTKIMWEPVNQGWLRDVYGEEILASVAEQHVACSGTTLGTIAGIEGYLDVVCKELGTRAFNRMEVYDQGIHNYIVWKLKPDWGWIDETDSIVNTVGCTSSERIKIIDDVAVIDGTIPAVVHQWDRHASLRAHVKTSDRFKIRPSVLAKGELRDSPTMIPRDPPTGPHLSELVEMGEAIDTVAIVEGASLTRTSFFYSTPPSSELATHGHTFSDIAFRSYECAPFEAYRFDELTLVGSDGIVLHDGAAIPDTIVHIMNWAAGSSTQDFQYRTHLHLRAAMPVSTASDAGVFVGFTAAWRNYAHWMQESLPKLFAFLHLRERVPNLKLIVPPFEPGSFQEQTLELLAIEPTSTVRIGHDHAVSFEDAWVTTSSDIWAVPPLVPIAAARLVAAVAARQPEPATCGERVYVHRVTGSRQVANFTAVETLLYDYGFRVVSFENMPVATQIAVMEKARFVIGEHGAGLANIMFCRAGTSVLELFNPVSPQPAHWSLASALNLNFGYIVGTHAPSANASVSDWNSPYDVPLDRLEDAIRAMLGPPETAQTLPNQQATCKPGINFLAHDEFEIGGVQFALAGAQPATDEQRVLIYKDRGFIDSYIETLPDLSVRRAFEFGIYQGGSAIFLTTLLGLEKFVCVDISDRLKPSRRLLSERASTQRSSPISIRRKMPLTASATFSKLNSATIRQI